jgi:hypothetical protein
VAWEQRQLLIQGEKDFAHTWGRFRKFCSTSHVVLHFLAAPAFACLVLAEGRRKWDTTRLAAPTFFPTLGSGFPVPHLGGSALPVPSSAYALHLRSAHTSLWDALAATLSRLSGSRHSFLAKLVRPSLVPLFPSSSRWLYLTTSLLPGQFSVQKSLAHPMC